MSCFSGDMNKWLKLANTIELRILLRQSKLTDATVTYLNSKYAQLQSLNNFVDADVLINPGYSSNDAKQNPFLVLLEMQQDRQLIQPYILHLQNTLLMY
jgi:hypothetical protein